MTCGTWLVTGLIEPFSRMSWIWTELKLETPMALVRMVEFEIFLYPSAPGEALGDQLLHGEPGGGWVDLSVVLHRSILVLWEPFLSPLESKGC